MKFLTLISFTLVTHLVICQIDSGRFDLTELPTSLDVNRQLRGDTGEILVWAMHKDKLKGEYSLSVLLVKTVQDSAAIQGYELSQQISRGPKFDSWTVPTVYRHPPVNHNRIANPSHYTIKRQEIYYGTLKPFELKSVWKRGSYYLKINQHKELIELGINENFWYLLFNQHPTASDFLSFR